MKARPILFNTDMVKAILAGQKTQTRREAKNIFAAPRFRSGWKAVRPDGRAAISTDAPAGMLGEACPFGQPGDLLYVRETFAICDDNSIHDGGAIYLASDPCGADRWKPSIHMPRWASRLTLEITDVRVERLQDISEEDARSEGIQSKPGIAVIEGKQTPSPAYFVGGLHPEGSPSEAFRSLWSSIYSNWHTNPWVWVVEYKVHHCNVDALLREREAA